MDLSKFPLFSAIAGKLAWLSQRQQVLAQNIANANTPGFVPSDVAAVAFRDLVATGSGRVALATTSGAHLAGLEDGERRFKEEAKRLAFPLRPSANAVDLEEEMMKVADTAMQYQLVTNLYKKQINLIRIALGRSG